MFRYRAQSVQVRDAGCGGQQQQQQRRRWRPWEQLHGPGQGLPTQESLVLQGQLERGNPFALKGLSHEINKKNFDKFTEPCLSKGRGCFFKFFKGSNDCIKQKVYLLRLMPVWVGLIML